MKNWVILFVRTGAEKKVALALKKMLNAEEYLPFLPTRETPRRSKGVVCKERKLLFPSYVFIQTEIDADLIADNLASMLTGISRHEDIYRILHYGDNEKNVAMREKERQFWERLFDPDFCVAGSAGVKEGDTIRIISGPLVALGKEGRIKKINRHKREAVVEMEVMGDVREVRVMLEVVGKGK